jgi:hypothetical protein
LPIRLKTHLLISVSFVLTCYPSFSGLKYHHYLPIMIKGFTSP